MSSEESFILGYIEFECSQYFERDYMFVKSVFRKGGIVDDVFKEIGKFLTFPKTDEIYTKRDGQTFVKHAWVMARKYYMFHPFNFEEYLKFVADNYSPIDNVLLYLFPGIKIIYCPLPKPKRGIENGVEIIHNINLCYCDAGYIFSSYLRSDRYGKVSTSFISFRTADKYINSKNNLEGLKALLKTVKVYETSSFDYYQYIVDNELDYVGAMTILCTFVKPYDMYNATQKLLKMFQDKKA
jgi:hypothetical protein